MQFRINRGYINAFLFSFRLNDLQFRNLMQQQLLFEFSFESYPVICYSMVLLFDHLNCCCCDLDFVLIVDSCPADTKKNRRGKEERSNIINSIRSFSSKIVEQHSRKFAR